MPRARTTARPKPEGEPPAKKQKSSKQMIETTVDHYKVIDRILQYAVLYNAPLNQLYAYCGYTQKALPYHFYPVLTRAPPSQATLPLEMTCGDKGYFPGADQPSTVRLAIISAFTAIFPNSDPMKQAWKHWEVYKNNAAFYGTQLFEGPGAETPQDIKDTILTTYAYGGTKPAMDPKLVRICTQKKFHCCVENAAFFASKPPAGDRIPQGVEFPRFKTLLERNALYVEERKKTLLEAKPLKKKLADASEEEEEESVSDDGEE